MSFKNNIITNYVGNAWSALMGFVFIPFYIKLLGAEAYGLIGIFIFLQTWLELLDLGVTQTLGREMAKLNGGHHTPRSIRNLLRSIEYITITVSIGIAIILGMSSEWLSLHWVQTNELSNSTIKNAFLLMALVISIRFIENIYRSSLIGLEKQVVFNILNCIFATLRGLGATLILMFASTDIESFFIWQGIVSTLSLITFCYVVYNNLPDSSKPAHFCLQSIKNISRFTGGIIVITFLTMTLAHIDKLALSRLLSLKEFGYFSFAFLAAASLRTFMAPISRAIYPRLSALTSSNDIHSIVSTFHRGTQLVTVIMGTMAITLIFFAEPILYLWTQDHEVTNNVKYLLQILALSNLFAGIVSILFQTQYAYGEVKLAIKIHTISIIFFIPILYKVAPAFGALGTAILLLIMQIGYLLIACPLMFKNAINQERWNWYFYDIIIPLSTIIIVISFSWSILPKNLSHTLIIISAILASITALALGFLSSTMLRKPFLQIVAKFIRPLQI